MGMVLEHQLSACYAAGSLGGTLGRLGDSLRRLSRAHSTGSREQPGLAETAWFPEPAKLARLNQTLRLMSDAWQCRITASRHMDHIDRELDRLREGALSNPGLRQSTERPGEYQLLAQALANLMALEQKSM